MAGGLSLHSRDLSAGILDKSQSWGPAKGNMKLLNWKSSCLVKYLQSNMQLINLSDLVASYNFLPLKVWVLSAGVFKILLSNT